MCIIKINSKCREYKKEGKGIKQAIHSSMVKLAEKIRAEGGEINKIYNKDNVIYDRINNELFIYKSHGMNNVQLRIVYGYKKIDDEQILYMVDYVVKKKNDKRYIKQFNNKFENIKICELSFDDEEIAL